MQEEKEAIRTEDIVDDAFTTEVVEEYLTVLGDPAALNTAWRVEQTMAVRPHPPPAPLPGLISAAVRGTRTILAAPVCSFTCLPRLLHVCVR